MNRGEKNELIFKIYLCHLKKNNDSSTVLGEIAKIGFDKDEYKELFEEIDFNNLTDPQFIKKISKQIGAEKSPPKSKADIYINGIGYSVKYTSGGMPSIVNHTTRVGFLRIANELKQDISLLDYQINNYWKLRESKVIGEDCGNNNINSPFREYGHIWKPYLEYFCFDGTGSNVSTYPANKLIMIPKVNNPSSWTAYSRNEIVEKIWTGLYFCMRGGKGMPKNYKNSSKRELISPWTRYISNKYRGALSIRYKPTSKKY